MTNVVITYKDGTADETACDTDAIELLGLLKSSCGTYVRFGSLVARLDEIRSVKVVEK